MKKLSKVKEVLKELTIVKDKVKEMPMVKVTIEKLPKIKKEHRSTLTTYILGAIVIAVLMILVVEKLTEDTERLRASDTEEYFVQRGDTVWNIAQNVQDGTGVDLSETVYHIMDINDIQNAQIKEGQKIVIPILANK